MPAVKTSAVVTKLKKAGVKAPATRAPLWTGPEGEGPNGGVTQGLISSFLVCRERFRLKAIEGLRPADTFEAKMEYGSMWHVCEEALASKDYDWQVQLPVYCRDLCRRYPLQQEQINHWYEVCKALFPHYIAHWAAHPDVQNRTPLLQEQTFDVPYKLPSGRTVRLRGKWDAVDLIGKGEEAGVFLQENKTKSSIDQVKIARQLSFDLQTCLYLVALNSWDWGNTEYGPPTNSPSKLPVMLPPILGVRYNVIRRSAHKSVDSMLKKLEEDRKAGRISEWFARWQVLVSPNDLTRFRRECLDPVLEQMSEWWEHMERCREGQMGVWDDSIHYRMPYIYSPIMEGGYGDVDAYLENGSEVGLQISDCLFPELI